MCATASPRRSSARTSVARCRRRGARVRHRLGEPAPLPARLGVPHGGFKGSGYGGTVALFHGGVHPHQARSGETVLIVNRSPAMRSGPVVDRSRLEGWSVRELEHFAKSNSRSRERLRAGKGSLLGGGPMSWMTKRASASRSSSRGTGAPLSTRRPRVYGLLPQRHRCHGQAFAAGDRRARRCAGGRRHHDDASERGRDRRGEELSRRFGLTAWQATLSATDADRFAIRLGARDRAATEDPRLDYC